MRIPILGRLSPLSLLILILHLSPYSATNTTENHIDFIKNSCDATLYKALCFSSLSGYAWRIKSNPKTLAETALNVTLSETKSVSKSIRNIWKHRDLRPREAAAVADCVEEIRDSVHEIRESLSELKHPIGLPNRGFELVISDVQTWVSAALTDEETCMDGIRETAAGANVKRAVRGKILKVAHLTSNALAFVNKYAATHHRG